MGRFSRRAAPLCAGLLFALLSGGLCSAQSFSISASNAAGFAGDSVQVSVAMSNDQSVRGFTFGLEHDAGFTLDSIGQGSTLLATNGGSGAEYEFMNLTPAGGPGGIYGVIISLSAPIDEIPVGTNQPIADLTYTIDAGTLPGTSTSLDFSGSLGSPVVQTVFSVAGVSFFPTATSGSITVETPPVENLSCVLVDPCVCEFDISWTNPVAYDSIVVTLGGATVATLGGGATTTTVTLPQGNNAEVCVVGIINSTGSAGECCIIDCPVIPPVLEPQGLTCVVDPVTCDATVTWTNAGVYQSIAVTFDGTTVAMLAGTATTTTVNIPDFNVSHQICLVTVDDCGLTLASACCNVECLATEFIRGDSNSDANIDISDPVRTLGFLFAMETVECVKALDSNDDGSANLADVVYILAFQFTNGPAPATPFPACGFDATPDALECDAFTGCP